MVTYGKRARKEKPGWLLLCPQIFNCILHGPPFGHRPHTFHSYQKFSFCHLSNLVSSFCLWIVGGNRSTRRNLQPQVRKMSKFHKERPLGWNQTQAAVPTAPQGANPGRLGQFLTKISHHSYTEGLYSSAWSKTDHCWDRIKHPGLKTIPRPF